MAYSFRETDTDLTAALRRVARSQVETGIAEFDDPGLSQAEAIHQVRKRCKKVRGLLRLVRPGFSAYGEENRHFRDLARLLSDARDATAQIETLNALEARFEEAMAADIFAAVRETLRARRAALDEDDLAERMGAVRAGFVEALERIDDWKVRGDAGDVLSGGVAKTYSRAAKALATAAESGDPEDVHEWRKRVKYHWYHLRLLRRAWPALAEAWIGEADQLSYDLGDHHDLAVFRSETLPDIKAGSEEGRQLLDGLMRAEQARLEAEGFERGGLMFAEPAKAAGERLAAWWSAWREPVAA